MNIQSLSVVVPTGNCVNKCKFCVSRQHREEYPVCEDELLNECRWKNGLRYAASVGCNSMVLTGISEPQQNMNFIKKFLSYNFDLINPIHNVSIQTTGAGMTKDKIRDLAHNGVSTLALSLNGACDAHHWEVSQMAEKMRVSVGDICENTKKYGMNLRISFNLSDYFGCPPEVYFNIAEGLGADMVTFRKLYASGNSEEADWVREHSVSDEHLKAIRDYVLSNGTPICRLPYGHIKYGVHGISTVIDDDCMAKENIDEMKYLILRPNGHLYSRWDDKASLVF